MVSIEPSDIYPWYHQMARKKLPLVTPDSPQKITLVASVGPKKLSLLFPDGPGKFGVGIPTYLSKGYS